MHFSSWNEKADGSPFAKGNDHLFAVDSNGWAVWRDICVRTTGFRASAVLDLANSSCAEAADMFCAASGGLVEQWSQVQLDLGRCVERESSEDQTVRAGVEESGTAWGWLPGQERASPLPRSERKADGENCELSHDLVFQIGEAKGAYEQSKTTYALAWEAALAQTAIALKFWARDELFRQAVAWQNLPALRNAIDPIALDVRCSPGRQRKREELVAKYLQRYAVKNDSIGFFGPIAWAAWSEAQAGAQLSHGQQWLVQREVFFEDWAMQAFADSLSESPELRPWLVPARAPYLMVEGERFFGPTGAAFRASRRQALAFVACDGEKNAEQVVRALLLNPFSDFADEEEVFAELAELKRANRISWQWSIAAGDVRPERRLRRQLVSIADASMQRTAVRRLDELDDARRRIVTSNSSSESLATALAAANETFERLTGLDSRRRHGEIYGARAIMYEDCRRDVSLSFGSDLLEQILEPLALILASARWYVSEAARRYRAEFLSVFAELVRARSCDTGEARSISLPQFWLAVQHLFFEKHDELLSHLDVDLQEKWKRIILPGGGQRVVVWRGAQLLKQVEDSFRAPDCGWRAACHHSPDVMICAQSTEAIAAGEFTAVLGELHMGINTLLTSALFHQHPNRTRLLQALRSDLGSARVLPLLSADGTRQPIRTKLVTDQEHDLEVRIAIDAHPQAPSRAKLVSDFVVEKRQGELVIRSKDDRHQFEPVEFFGHLLSQVVAGRFSLLPQAAHIPRVMIDKLVVQRETWRVPCKNIHFARIDDEAVAFGEARRWAKDLGFPRFVFVKLPWEAKPIYLDFASPILVRVFARQIRNALAEGGQDSRELSISEMLPAHDQLWFSEANGDRCTSELRFVVVHRDDLPARHGVQKT